MRTSPRSNESLRPRRAGRLATALAASGLLLTGCGVEPAPTEEIPTYVVSTTETMPTHLAPPAVAEEPPQPGIGYFTVCFGAFVDYPSKTLTVNPLVLPVKGRDPKLLNPLTVQFNEDGTSRINPRLPYEPQDYDWWDSRGKNIGDFPPLCTDNVPVHETKIVQTKSDRYGDQTPVLAAPAITEGEIVDAWNPGDVRESGLYHQTFRFEDSEELLKHARSMAAP